MTTAIPSPLPRECLPNIENLVTEDGAPVDRIFTEKQYRLLTSCLYSGWTPSEGRPYLVLVNVGWFFKQNEPPLVPDCLLSLDVACPENLHAKEGHSYFQWLMGKPPEVVIEIVSDKRGGEDTKKMKEYAHLKVSYYIIFDPEEILADNVLRVFELRKGKYEAMKSSYMEEVGLGLKLWKGPFEGHKDTWLRWCDGDGKILLTAEERAEKAERRARLAAKRIRELEEALNRRNGKNT